MLRYRLSELPDHLRTQAEAQLSARKRPPKPPAIKAADMGDRTQRALGETPLRQASLSPLTPPVRRLADARMTQTERRFRDEVLHGEGSFEAITFRLPGGSRYTPDWLYLDPDGVPVVVEVKGSYRLGSEGRARTAFLEAAANFSSIFRFVWAVLGRDGAWDLKLTVPSDRDAQRPLDADDKGTGAVTASPARCAGKKKGGR